MELRVVDVSVVVLVERVEGTLAAIPGVPGNRVACFTRKKLQPARAERVEQVVDGQAIVSIPIENVPQNGRAAPLPAGQRSSVIPARRPGRLSRSRARGSGRESACLDARVSSND